MADADVLVFGAGPSLRTASLLDGRPVPPFISARMPPHTCKSHRIGTLKQREMRDGYLVAFGCTPMPHLFDIGGMEGVLRH